VSNVAASVATGLPEKHTDSEESASPPDPDPSLPKDAGECSVASLGPESEGEDAIAPPANRTMARKSSAVPPPQSRKPSDAKPKGAKPRAPAKDLKPHPAKKAFDSSDSSDPPPQRKVPPAPKRTTRAPLDPWAHDSSDVQADPFENASSSGGKPPPAPAKPKAKQLSSDDDFL
jgi:hypothetical protein